MHNFNYVYLLDSITDLPHEVYTLSLREDVVVVDDSLKQLTPGNAEMLGHFEDRNQIEIAVTIEACSPQ